MGPGASGASATGGRGSTLTAPHPCSPRALAHAHLSDLLEALRLHIGEDVALGPGEDLKGHGAVVVLQGRDVVVTDGQLRAGVDLVPGVGGDGKWGLGDVRWDTAAPQRLAGQPGALGEPGLAPLDSPLCCPFN